MEGIKGYLTTASDNYRSKSMSYDLRIAVKVEGCDKYATIAYPEYSDPTYNLGDMFRACMGWDYEQGEYYRCDYAIGAIERGISELAYNDKEYAKYNPPNGWGDIKDALDALTSLRKCIREQAEEIPLKCLYVRW